LFEVIQHLLVVLLGIDFTYLQVDELLGIKLQSVIILLDLFSLVKRVAGVAVQNALDLHQSVQSQSEASFEFR
jgi:ABC-type uncharacterized transport system permease subunit